MEPRGSPTCAHDELGPILHGFAELEVVGPDPGGVDQVWAGFTNLGKARPSLGVLDHIEAISARFGLLPLIPP